MANKMALSMNTSLNAEIYGIFSDPSVPKALLDSFYVDTNLSQVYGTLLVTIVSSLFKVRNPNYGQRRRTIYKRKINMQYIDMSLFEPSYNSFFFVPFEIKFVTMKTVVKNDKVFYNILLNISTYFCARLF